jgi:hypothetical protein
MSANQLPSESGSTWLAQVIWNFPSARGDGLGRRERGGAGESGPRISADPGRHTLVADRRWATEAGVDLPVAKPAAGMDKLHGAFVGAPSTRGPKRRKSLPRGRLRPARGGGSEGVHAQVWMYGL